VRFAGQPEEEESKEEEKPPAPKKSFLLSLGGEDHWNVIDLPTFDDKSIGEGTSTRPVQRASCWTCFRMYPATETVHHSAGKVSLMVSES